jgi:hypothetical protein
MTVDGRRAQREPLLGWQQQFETSAAGEAELRWSTPLLSRGLQLLQVVFLVGLVVVASRRRRMVATGPTRRRRIPAAEPLMVVGTGSDDPGTPSSGVPS